jgi:hypothetical protein
MEPFFLKKYRPLFHFTQSPEYCLNKDTNQVLFMERCFQHRAPEDLEPESLELIKKFRDKYKTVVFFNGQPEAGTNRLDLLPYVDRLFYKSVFTDRANYTKDLYAKNLFADYYHKKYGVSDTERYSYKPDPALNLDRIELSWNIGVGSYPRRNWPQRAGTVLARLGFPGLRVLFKAPGLKRPPDFSSPSRSIAVHARIDPVTSPSISFQRNLFLETMKGDARFLTGLVPQNAYYNELLNSKIVLSPFGWGEVCFRDFEALISGALLLKPDMSHLKTFPDVYIPYETYIPLDWDAGDLKEKAAYYLENHGERKRICEQAFEQYRAELSALESRFSSLLGGIV